jgi:hypothetical protein
VPKLHQAYFSIFGVSFSDKSFTYFLALQMMLNSGLASVLPATSGLVLGLLYTANVLYLSSFRLPKALTSFCKRYVDPWWNAEVAVPAAAARRNGNDRNAFDDDDQYELAGMNVGNRNRPAGTLNAAAGGAGGTRRRNASPRVQNPAEFDGSGVVVDQAALERLVGMGFERARAEAALRQTVNDENAAVNRLIEGS